MKIEEGRGRLKIENKGGGKNKGRRKDENGEI